MSNRAVGSAVLLALILAGAGFFLFRNPGQGAPQAGDAFLRFDPASVESLIISPGSIDHRLRRAPDGRWTYSWGRIEWPAALPDAAQSSFARLSNLTVAAPAAPDAAIGDNPRVVTIGLRDGSTLVLRISTHTLGGRTLAQAQGPGATDPVRSGLIDSALVDPLFSPGPESWRNSRAIPGAGDASRITITQGDTSIALAKVEGKWHLSKPVSARAEPAAVANLLSALADLGVQKFENAPAGASSPINNTTAGLATPRLSIVVEVDERAPDARGEFRVRTRASRLVIGGAADADGSLLFASPDPAAGALMTLAASAVSRISTAPRNYLASTATFADPADVFMVSMTSGQMQQRGFRRDMDRWTRLLPDGSRQPAESGPVEELLLFLASRPAEPDPAADADDVRLVQRIELMDSGGDVIDLLNIGYTPDGALAVRAGNLVLRYPGVSAPAVLELMEFASLPPLPTQTTSVPVDAPVSK